MAVLSVHTQEWGNIIHWDTETLQLKTPWEGLVLKASILSQ